MEGEATLKPQRQLFLWLELSLSNFHGCDVQVGDTLKTNSDYHVLI